MKKVNTTYLPVIGRAVLAVVLAIPVLLLPGVLEAQTTHVVMLLLTDPEGARHFFPTSLTIPVGDTVEWQTRGVSLEHNITWDEGEFPQSPTSSTFTYSHTFDSPGEFRYRCTIHNRSGEITVVAPAVPFEINAGLNDAWKNPDTPGQGFFINVFPSLGKMFLAWFTYDTTRPPGSVHANLGDPGHRWLTAFGSYSGDHAVLDIEITEGGIFDEAEPEPTQHAGGTITVYMTDCENGTITYDIEPANLRGVIPIQRIAPDNVPLCESLAEQMQQSR